MKKLLALFAGAAIAIAVSSYANISSSITGSFPVPTGVVLDYTGTTAPVSYRAADGTALSRTTCAKLFAAVGTTWGVGDGSTTFNLPNLNRRVTVGSGGTGTATLAAAVGSVGGEETHTMTAAELVAHNHVINIIDPGHVHGPGVVVSGVATWVGTAAASFGFGSTPSATTGITATSNNAGSSTAFNQLQPSAVVMKIVKADC